MTAQHQPQDDLMVLLDSLLEELMGMSDEQVLDGEAPASVQARGLALLSTAKQVASRRRLAAAKAGLAMTRADSSLAGGKEVSVAQAKAFLYEAVNAGTYTLAARQLDELSDQAALTLYGKLARLGVRSPGRGNG